MSDELWPRRTSLSIDGFADGHKKIARGADIEIVARADAAPGRDVPEIVEVRYLQGGARGRENMSRSGSAERSADAFQLYNFAFKDVLAPIEFYLRGGDDRLGPLYLDVVDSPTVGEMILHCQYPAYTHRDPHDIPVSGPMKLPRGTRVVIEARANKDIVQVQVDDLIDEQTPITHKIDLSASAASGQRSFEYVVDSLDSDKVLRFTLLDTDGIRSRDPVRLNLAATPDEPPQVSVQLRGIGSAITAKARLPMAGDLVDDFGIARAWFEFHVNDEPPQNRPLTVAPRERDKVPVDEALDVEPLGLTPKQKLHLAIQADDTYALGSAANRGTSQRYVLDVVTPEQLRSLLEARELQLRRRFETIIQEMTENRDTLARMEFGANEPVARPAENKPAEGSQPPSDNPAPSDAKATDAKAGEAKVTDPQATTAKAAGGPARSLVEPGDEAPAAQGASEPRSAVDRQAEAERRLAQRRVYAERALQNSQRSADETLGLAVAFDTIREELVNNRVDTEELKLRLKEGIADPLRHIAGEMFPELERRLRKLQSQLTDPVAGIAAQKAAGVQADAILVEMQQVLGKMVELESFNEVLDMLRGIIDAQQDINDRTKQKQKERLRNLLEED